MSKKEHIGLGGLLAVIFFNMRSFTTSLWKYLLKYVVILTIILILIYFIFHLMGISIDIVKDEKVLHSIK